MLGKRPEGLIKNVHDLGRDVMQFAHTFLLYSCRATVCNWRSFAVILYLQFSVMGGFYSIL